MAVHRTYMSAIATALATGALVTTAAAQTSHEDWPKIQTKPYINEADRDATFRGSEKNDELLGGHGRDKLYGLGGDDVLWGDYKPTGNTAHQRDRLYAGPGDDWVYGSHGRSVVYGGPGKDTIRIWFGRGFVDCGDGKDILYLSRKSDPKVKRRNCEKISHKSAREVADED